MCEMAQIHYTLRKKTSHITKTFLEVSIGWWIINVVGNFSFNPNMEDRHFNILIRKSK
jgi:hypothetical protein